ncbi:MAG TPA: ISAs1 family transposase [Dermatophilaceae bacterium]
MSACVSSLIPSAVRHPVRLAAMAAMSPQGLLEALSAVADPRRRRGVRHRFISILALCACAVLAGARSFVAIAEWAMDLTPLLRAKLGIGRVPPCESTIRRVLQRMDPDVLDEAVSAWLARCSPVRAGRSVFALDGKTSRGARCPGGRAVHLFSAIDQVSGVVMGQCAVDVKTNEINAFGPLLDRFDITDAIITADALHTQRAHADYLLGRGAHYILIVKGNQPSLHRQLRSVPWKQVPAVDTTTDKGHGRVETRTMKLIEIPAGIAFPHAALAIQITRTRRPFARSRASRETVYAVTDLTYDDTTAAELADAIRGHWSIENRLHWIRDVTFAEDHSQIRTGHGPQVMATFRNLAVSLHRLHGATNIAAACRRISRDPDRVLSLVR